MNNVFKTRNEHSRFDILNEKQEKQEKRENFPVERETKSNVFMKKIDSRIKKETTLNESHFPELSLKKKEENQVEEENSSNDYLNITNKSLVEKEEDSSKESKTIHKDWIILSKASRREFLSKKAHVESEDENVLQEEPQKIINKLVELYETWKRDYIENWGMDEYEYHYRFPGYNYHYFDELDDYYEEEHNEWNDLENEEDDFLKYKKEKE